MAQQLRLDEALHATADRIIVTTGAQEALDLCLRVLCPDSNDVILARSPIYIGITGAACGSRRSIVPVAPKADEKEPVAVARFIGELRAGGRHARVLYLSPDYSLGEMPRGDDAAALAVLCSAQGVAILEDNPYGLFRFDGARVPPLSALQGQDCVLCVGT